MQLMGHSYYICTNDNFKNQKLANIWFSEFLNCGLDRQIKVRVLILQPLLITVVLYKSKWYDL